MPYYVYKIRPPASLEPLADFESYREARTFTRDQRKSLTAEDESTVRMIFASSPAHAERLLKEKREARPLGEDA